MIETLINEIRSSMAENRVDIPLLEPLLKPVLTAPLIGDLVAFLLWRPILAFLFLFTCMMLVSVFLVWWERKAAARIQWRVGPREVSRQIGGLIQPVADGLRYMFQEVIVHRDADKFYFIQIPILAFIPFLLPLLFVNAGNLVPIETPYGIPLMLALIGLLPVMIVAVGWASNNRFGFIGAIREAFMYFAYEVPFIISVIAMLVLYGTANPVEIVKEQGIWWGILRNPIAALVFLITAAMATSRLPFEIPEADQEIAFGPNVEYSGIMFGLVMMMAYEKAFILGCMMTILFLGGGTGPAIPMLGDLSGALWFLIKTLIVLMLLTAFCRAVYPRYRLDQALSAGWSSMLSLALIALLISVILGVVM